jgi:lipopolysaccharide core galacturonosyltransferase RgtB
MSRGRAFTLLACYFLLQILFRTLVSDSAELDESEQLLWVQDWRWGYGSDPPLYTWLQILVFHLFGTGIFGLALLKNVLLFSAFLFTYLSAREASGDERLSVLAMFSLLLFPQITWESQRDLTHSVLATALAAATFFMAARVARSRRPLDYLLLGVCLGLGTLSKYSYCLFAFALGIAALTVPAFRGALLNKGLLLTFGAFLLITAWHFQWILRSPDLAWSRPEEVIHGSASPFLRARLLGVLSVVKCAVMLGAVPGAVYWLAFAGSANAQPASDGSASQHWIGRTWLVIGLMCLGLVLATGIELRDRWFQPVAFLGALSAAWLVRPRLGPLGERRFLALVGSLALIVLIVLPGIPLSASVTRRPTRLNAPYSELSKQLESVLPESALIVAANRLVGGNLRLRFQQHGVIAPEFRAETISTNVPWFVIWDATKSPAPRADLVGLVARLRGVDIGVMAPAYVQANCKYTRAKTMTLGYLSLPNAR